jgi:glycosyltransferase involved in cell wall biosynthesis
MAKFDQGQNIFRRGVNKIRRKLAWFRKDFPESFFLFLEEALPQNSLPRIGYLIKFARGKKAIESVPDGFSIVVTTRNRKQFLSWAVAAVIANTREPFELIIMDNASDDGTGEICKVLEKKYPNIVRYVRLNRNYGTNAYALGFLRSRFKYLVDMDDDILALSEDWDIEAARAFQAIPNLGFLSLNVVQDKYTTGAKPATSHYSELIYNDTTLEKGPAGGWFAITTRNIYNEAGGFIFRPYKPFHLEDGLFLEQIAKKGYVWGILKKKFCYHASGPYWNSAYGYNRIWKEKYQRDFKNYLPRIASVEVDEVPSVEYAKTILKQTEEQMAN